jgi:hypothetical protein
VRGPVDVSASSKCSPVVPLRGLTEAAQTVFRAGIPFVIALLYEHDTSNIGERDHVHPHLRSV